MIRNRLMSCGVACLLLLMGLLLGVAPAMADDPPTLTARVLHSLEAYPAGGTYPLILELNVRPGYHINAQRPSDPDAYPTKLTWRATPDCALEPAVFPAPRVYKPDFSPKPLEVYDGRVLVRASLKVAPGAAAGPREIVAVLDFQACDDQACLMPENLEVPLAVRVAPAGKPGKALNQELFKK